MEQGVARTPTLPSRIWSRAYIRHGQTARWQFAGRSAWTDPARRARPTRTLQHVYPSACTSSRLVQPALEAVRRRGLARCFANTCGRPDAKARACKKTPDTSSCSGRLGEEIPGLLTHRLQYPQVVVEPVAFFLFPSGRPLLYGIPAWTGCSTSIQG